jgi:ADP-ribosylglycohydrolase
MSEFVVLKFKPDALQKWQLPDQDYYLPTEALIAGVINHASLLPELLLHGLQTKLASPDVAAKSFDSAMSALFDVLYKPDLETETGTDGNNWSVKYGDIDLTTDEIVTIQRQNRLLAAFRQEGPNLIICAYEPLDSDALNLVKSVCKDVDRMANEVIGQNKLKYAARLSGGFGQMYAADAGNTYLSYWQYGLGVSSDGTLIAPWHEQTSLAAIPHMHTGTQLQVHEFFNQHDFSFLEYFSNINKQLEQPAVNHSTNNDDLPRNKFIGCLLGGAIGDAFGAPVEFMSRERILAKHGPKGVTSLLPAYGRIGAITDDTQMTLFTAEGLLRAYVRGCHKGTTTWLGCIGHAYQRWLQTQQYDSPRSLDVQKDGLLWQFNELHDQRAPGNTCLSALAEMKTFETLARNNSKGCGGVMRVAPIGLFCWRKKNDFSLEECFDLASDAAHLTHGHATGYLAAGSFAVIIYQLLDGSKLVDAATYCLNMLREKHESAETMQAIDKAISLSTSNLETEKAIEQLGEGWIAEEALAISLYCVLVAKNFNHLMTISVSHSGDSDSTGAIAGNLWGAIHGLDSIESNLTEKLELAFLITDIANDLLDFPTWDIGLYTSNTEFDNLISRKYPGV